MTDPVYKRPITVTVSSAEPDAGKTTLIALVAHALRGSGHRTMVPPDSAGLLHNYRLDELFDVTFVESLGPVYTGRQVEGEVQRRLNQEHGKTVARIEEFRDANIKLLKQLEEHRATVDRKVEDGVVRRTEEMHKAYQQRFEDLTRENHELRQQADNSLQEAQQARNALAEAAIIITGLHQDLRTKKA